MPVVCYESYPKAFDLRKLTLLRRRRTGRYTPIPFQTPLNHLSVMSTTPQGEATDASADSCKSVCHWLSRHFQGHAVCCLTQGERARGRRGRTERAQRALLGRGRRGRRLAPTGARRRATGRGRRRRGCVASGHNHRGLLAVCAGSCCLRGGFSGCRCCATACGGLRAGAALWGGAARGTDDGLPPPPRRLFRSARHSSISMAAISAMPALRSLRRLLRPTTR